MSEQTTIPIGDISHRITKGTTPRMGGFTQSGISFVKVESITEEGDINPKKLAFIDEETNRTLARSVLQSDDLLFSIAGTIGRVARVAPAVLPANTNQALAIIRPDKTKVDAGYLLYCLRDRERIQDALSMVVQSVQANLSLSELSAIRVPYRPLDEQRAIAEVLGALDDKIAANNRLLGTLTKTLEAAFSSICGHSATETVPFDQLMTITKGVSYRSADLREAPTALVTLKSFDRTGGYSPRGLKSYAGPFKAPQVVHPGELVVALTDLTQAAEVVGRTIRVPGSARYEKLVASLDLAVIRPKTDIPIEFLLGVMLQGRFRSHCRSRTSGTTVLHLASDAIPTFLAPVVPTKLQISYAEIAKPILQLRDFLEGEVESLGATRDTLLPQLMSGELRVKDAAEVVGRLV